MWIVYALFAALSAATAITLTKAGLKKVDPVLTLAIQSILILVISWSAVFFQQKFNGMFEIEKRGWMFLVGAGIATCFASLFSYTALKSGDASVVSSIERVSLVITIVLAVLFLKEQLNWRVIAGAVLMVGGAILIGFSREAS
ncbi:MAG: EamA family transporter [Chitinophagaceae bacterium]|nr:MAG: EamA family transporter [Chitinophagaceae bacterium]